MTPELIVDGLIVLAVLMAIATGWRQGAFTSVLSTVGVVAGLIIGAALAPPVMQLTDSVALRFLLGLGTIIMLVGLGNLVGGILGASVRDRMRMRASQTIDSAIGSVFAAAATLIVVWLISIPLATGLSGPASQGIRHSTILGFVDRNTPPGLEQLPARITAMLNDSGLPPGRWPHRTSRSRTTPSSSSCVPPSSTSRATPASAAAASWARASSPPRTMWSPTLT